MKKILLVSAIALVATSASAFEVKPYVEGKVSRNGLKAEYKEPGDKINLKDNVFGGQLEVGAKLDQFRVGLEGYYNDKADDIAFSILPVELESKGLFLNGYWDIPLSEVKAVKPFIGVGVGYNWLKVSAKETIYTYPGRAKDKGFGWNVGLGVAYAVKDNVDLTVGYRYEYLGKVKDEDSKTKFYNNKVSFGVRYTF
ncbi:MAG: porin family protein [Alphaproteobacteria bacterium]|nr:porin family protein [Alphaproteobacteria bacterium]